jgi:hypothetical protein
MAPENYNGSVRDFQAPSALDRRLTVTLFGDKVARHKIEKIISLRALARRIPKMTAARKDRLLLIKLARFGDALSANGCLRHDANVLDIDGLETDYDAGKMPVEEASRRLREANVAALVYTSPSHTEPNPRWRVFCPTSETLPPERREALVARINGVLGGVLAGESFTLSQGYYFGSVKGNPAHRVELIEGRYIDLADDLDTGAIGKPAKAGGRPTKRKKAGDAARRRWSARPSAWSSRPARWWPTRWRASAASSSPASIGPSGRSLSGCAASPPARRPGRRSMASGPFLGWRRRPA